MAATMHNLDRVLRELKSGALTKILCMGSSIVEGTAGYASFRQPLLYILTERGMCVDMVGSKVTSTGDLNPQSARDYDHGGYSGNTLTAMLSVVATEMAYNPDLVILEGGANDTDSSVVATIAARQAALLDAIRAQRPGVPIIAHTRPMRRTSSALGMDGTISAQVLGVRDGCYGYDDVACIVSYPRNSLYFSSEFFADDTHPNNLGYRLMAENIATVMLGPGARDDIPKEPLGARIYTSVSSDIDVPQGAVVSGLSTAVLNCVMRDGTTQSWIAGTDFEVGKPIPGYVMRIKSSGTTVDATKKLIVQPLPQGVIH